MILVEENLEIPTKPTSLQGDGKRRVFCVKMAELPKDSDSFGGFGFFCWLTENRSKKEKPFQKTACSAWGVWDAQGFPGG